MYYLFNSEISLICERLRIAMISKLDFHILTTSNTTQIQTQLLMRVSIFEWKGGGEGRCWWVTGIGVAFEFFSNFFFNFLILGTGN